MNSPPACHLTAFTKIAVLFLLIVISLISCYNNATNPDQTTESSSHHQDSSHKNTAHDNYTQPLPVTPGLTAFINSSNSFGLELLKQLAKENSSANVAISPVSISQLLYLLANGASGEAEAELRDLLNYPGEWSDLNYSNRNWLYHISEIESFKLNLANSIWTSSTVMFQPHFREIAESYHTEIQQIAADPLQAVADINQWVSDSTHGMIQQIISHLDNVELLLLNAVYFHGTWSMPFDPERTTEADFTAGDGNIQKVQMMSQSGEFSYAESESAQLIRMHYHGGASMIIMLPVEKQALPIFLDKLPTDLLQSSRFIPGRKGTVELPRFKLDSQQNDMRQTFRQLGLNKALSGADFTAISDRLSKSALFQLSHRVVVEVDEKGTKAAAATVAYMAAETPPPPFHFRADRPFVFFIEDVNGIVIFAAVVNSITDN